MAYPHIDILDWGTLQPLFDRLQAAELTVETAGAWLQEWSDLNAALHEGSAQINRAVSENTADAAAEARFNHLVEDIVPKSSTANQALKQKFLALSDYVPAADTAMLLKRFRTEASIFREENIPLETELVKQGNEYDKTVGAMTIEWDGQVETLPQAGLHLHERDRATRERAWRLLMDRFLADRARLNELYLSMLPKRRQMARNAGFSTFRSYMWQAYNRFDYTPEDCFTFHDAIEHEVVPVATALNQQRATKLGLTTLRPWDMEVETEGEPLRPFNDVRDLEAGVQRMFNQVDPVLGKHFATLRDGFLDLPSRQNKAPGGYCASFPVSRRAYIFMNAAGTHDDVQTLLHEGGHAFHYLESARQPLVWNLNGPMEFCEVASMGMELLAAPYLAQSRGGFYSEADAQRAYAQKLRGIITFLPYMAVVDRFQHWVYAEAPDNITTTDLDAKWSELWDRFMPGIDFTGLQREKETGWQRKGHIFTVPFYYIEYGLAEVGAMQVWRNALHDQAQAVADYRAALALGDTRPLPALFQAANIRFAFDRDTVGELMRLVSGKIQELTTPN